MLQLRVILTNGYRKIKESMTNHTPTPRSQEPEDIQKRNFIKGLTAALLGFITLFLSIPFISYLIPSSRYPARYRNFSGFFRHSHSYLNSRRQLHSINKQNNRQNIGDDNIDLARRRTSLNSCSQRPLQHLFVRLKIYQCRLIKLFVLQSPKSSIAFRAKQ